MAEEQGISHLRQEYSRHELSEESVEKEPIKQFRIWFKDALAAEIHEPNAMALGTCGADGQPSVRIVLLKDFDEKGFVFYTNYNSNKGKDLAENPKAAITFLWLGLERQIRIEGTVEKVSAQDSDAYFESRPFGSRLGAWSSPQSQEISKEELLQREENFKEKYEKNETVPRPEHWGGYRLIPQTIEFWQGRPSRMHDRILYKLDETGNWRTTRLAP
ncbi:MAG: pyridoxamine 5'-phosphate oxidase [Sphingobacteriales bacterium]|nr:MAG: pyridoxamine 5'-phosphate oxidase [Sphingobacteriales bacterium]